ncbi:MAG: sigma 54-interacting transcriptional regulator [Planctomycetota bacterium]|jgi:Nif-specific regulatory protein
MEGDERKTRPLIRREVNELLLLLEIGQMLDASPDLREVVGDVLEVIAEHTAMDHATLTLLNRDTGELMSDASHGLSPADAGAGQGVIAKVIDNGRAAVVRHGATDPLYLDRTGGGSRSVRRRDIAFFCVPIKMGNRSIGALSADHLFEPPIPPEEDVRLLSIIASMIAQAVRLRRSSQEEQRRLREEMEQLREELRGRANPENIVGKSGAMQAVYDMIARVAGSDATVLICGESGVGKELVAHAVHHSSPRAGKPFVRVNCAALPETIIESELFGHEKGAFTGAVARRKGRFELANKGTLFLDEIGDFSASTQVRLLRVIQEREFERVGGTDTLSVDVRIVAATNRDLEAMVAAGEFRQDLYYRLNVFPIHVPPLRERRTDIVLLADHFAERHGAAAGKPIKRISTPAIDMLNAYHWPGNVRELENCIERAVLLSTDGVIHGHHLPPSLQTAEASGTVPSGPLKAALDGLEREMISDALKSTRGNKAKGARMLGLTERLMGIRVKKLGIDPKRFRTTR